MFDVRRTAILTAALVAVSSFGWAGAEESAKDKSPGGMLFVIGGGLRPDNGVVIRRMIAAAGGVDKCRFGVFPTASRSTGTAERFVEVLKTYGVPADRASVIDVRVEGSTHTADDPEVVEQIKQCTAAYFTGGDQQRITRAFLQSDGSDTPALKALRELWRRGGVIAGTSAGAAIMSATMFRDAMDVRRVLINGRLIEGSEIDRGLGFVGPELFVDQHFLKRGRIGRILPVMVQAGYKLGLGVEEDTAAIVHGSSVEVIGAKGVLLVDLGAATHDDSLGAFNLRNVRLSYLDRGDRHDLATGTTTPSPQKLAGMAIDPNAPDFRPYNRRAAFHGDILGDSAIVNAMSHLIDNREPEAVGLALPPPGVSAGQAGLGFEFRLKRDAESRGWFTGAFGGEDYTVLGIRLDVTPVRMAQPMYVPLQPATAAADVPEAR